MRRLLRQSTLLFPLLAGCGSDDVVAPTDTALAPFWSLSLNHEAITLGLQAGLDTLRLVATPVGPNGAPIDGLGTVSFTTTNLNAVSIGADGLLTGHEATPGVTIVAFLTARGVTHADTATVAVTDDPGARRLGTFSIQPVAPDSAKFAVGGTYLEGYRNLTPTLLDTDGNPMEGIPVRYQSLDNTTGVIDTWSSTITGLRPGYFDIVANATVYGERFTDTLHYRIGYPGVVKPNIYGKMYAYLIYEIGTFYPQSLTVGTGAVVELQYSMGSYGYQADMIFDDPAGLDSVPEQYACVTYGLACGDVGSIEAFGPSDQFSYSDYDENRTRARRFTQPGVYPYHSQLWGTTGTIIVVDESTP